jgi:hypothetical protein
MALPDQIYQNQKMYNINGQQKRNAQWYDRKEILEEHERAK